jgi:glycosidase
MPTPKAARPAARKRPVPPASVADLDFTPRGPVHPSPADWRDVVLYELMIDRFDDGRPRPPYNPKTAKRGRDPAEGKRYQGGTLKGVARRLDYIRNLGAGGVWVTLPLKNRPGDDASYHGYGPQDFLDVDPHFGTVDDLRALVAAAHRKGLYVVLDIVIDHAGDVFAYEGGHDFTYDRGRRFDFGYWRKGHSDQPLAGKPTRDDAVWPLELQSPDAFKRMGRMEPGKTNGTDQIDGDFINLKVLDLENPAVLSAVVAIYKYWVAVADVDGFRIDALRHVRPEAAGDFVHAIREYCASIGKLNFLQVGELTGDPAERAKYVGTNTPAPGERGRTRYPALDATLDFDLYVVLTDCLLGKQPMDRLRARFDFLQRHYRDTGLAGRNYVTFLENHDGGAGQVQRRLLNHDPDPRLAVVANGFLLTSIGIPCLYYGTEQGFDGGNGDFGGDEHVRECMFGGKWGAFDTTGQHFFNDRHPIYVALSKIAAVRAATPALRYGRQYVREISADGAKSFAHLADNTATLAYSRVLDAEEVLVALNLSPQARHDCVTVDAKLTPPGTRLRDLLGNVTKRAKVEEATDGRAFVRVPLKGRQMAVLARG